MLFVCFSIRPWDANNDLFEYDIDGVIKTKTRCAVGPLRTPSIINIPIGVERTVSTTSRPSQQVSVEDTMTIRSETLPGGHQLVGEVQKCTEQIMQLVKVERENSAKLSAIVSELQRNRPSEQTLSRQLTRLFVFLILPVVLACFVYVWLL